MDEQYALHSLAVGNWRVLTTRTVENFITGFPGREYQIREALAEVLGEEKSKFFFDKYGAISIWERWI